MDKKVEPKLFQLLQFDGNIKEKDVLQTNDGFWFVYRSIADILSNKGIFDFPDSNSVMQKMEEETEELKNAILGGKQEEIDEEFGDLIFTAVSLARKLGLDAEESLTRATEKFIRRFARLENAVIKDGKDITSLSMDELDSIWDRIKHKN